MAYHLQLRCVNCAGEHISAYCPKPFEEPSKCTNCFGMQSANYLVCPKIPRDRAKKNVNHWIEVKKSKNLNTAPVRIINNALFFVKVAIGVAIDLAPKLSLSLQKAIATPNSVLFQTLIFSSKFLSTKNSLYYRLSGNAYRNSVLQLRKLVGFSFSIKICPVFMINFTFL